MACDTRTLPGQTLSQRKEEVLAAVTRLNSLLAAGAVKPVISREGAIAFAGWLEADRGRVSDACAYRRLMAIGGSLAKAKIAAAEAASGLTVNKQTVASGLHSHDSGKSWHSH